MRLLLDTRLLIWALSQPERLDDETRALLEDPAHDVLFSAVSIWEIAIKAGSGRSGFTVRPELVARIARETGFIELPVFADVAAGVLDLPPHHRDPFDRLLIAQAISEPAWLYTVDPGLPHYSELVRFVGS